MCKTPGEVGARGTVAPPSMHGKSADPRGGVQGFREPEPRPSKPLRFLGGPSNQRMVYDEDDDRSDDGDEYAP